MATGGVPHDHPIYSTVLGEFNALRRLEDRPRLKDIPVQYRFSSIEEFKRLSFRLRTEIEWHRNQKKHNLSRGLPYQNQIILNETEFLLWQFNKQQLQKGLSQVQSVQPSLVAQKDKQFYGVTDQSFDPVYITDSDCRLINTPTYIHTQQQYRATHNLKTVWAQPSVSTVSVVSDFNNLPGSTPVNVSRDLQGLNLEGLNLHDDTSKSKIESLKSSSEISLRTACERLIIGPQFLQQIRDIKSPPPQIYGETPKSPPPQNYGAIPKRQGLTHPKLKVLTPFGPNILPPIKKKPYPNNPLPNKNPGPGIDLSKLIGQPLEFQEHVLPNIPDPVDYNERRKQWQMDQLNRRIEALEKEKAELASNLAKQSVKPRAAQTERQEINDLKSQMNDMMTMMKMVALGRGDELNATTDHETRVAQKFQQTMFEDNSFTATNMFVTLDRPTNIIPKETPRTPELLPCLKPSAIINTVGTFDPSAQPEADFRCVWDRILDQTRNYKIYEHEYVTCLRIVMKGQAGKELDKMIKEYKGDLDLILDAIQDLFIPQHTIYDELVDLKSFSRRPNEHMRTMVRRASLEVCKLRPTVAPAAWPDRRHTLLSQMIKQVIDRNTFVHLRAEELRCAQAGTTLSIEAITNIIDHYETSHDLIPKAEIRMQYDVHSMRLTNQPDVHKSELDILRDELMTLKTSILAPKRRRLNDPAEKLNVSMKAGKRPMAKPKRRFTEERMDTSDYSANPKGVKRGPDNNANQPRQYSYSSSTPSSQSQTQSQSQSQYSYTPASQSQSKPQRFSQPRLQTQNTRSNSQPRNRSVTPAQYRSLDYYKPRYNNNGYNRSRSKSPYRRQSNYRGRSPYRNNNYNNGYNGNRAKKSYNFRGKKHDVALNFYKCAICPDAHESGTSCTTVKAIPYAPNE